jgi:hypothetical protein
VSLHKNRRAEEGAWVKAGLGKVHSLCRCLRDCACCYDRPVASCITSSISEVLNLSQVSHLARLSAVHI